jgi:hypothetical protein
MTLKEAIDIHEKCDPDDCDCETCPIGKDIEWEVSDGGVVLKGSICSMLLLTKDMLEEAEKK